MATTRKPVQQRALATVDAIIEAGFVSLARHGMAGTTTRHIAQIAGISVGSLYEYFPNKEAIYAAMSRKLVDDIVGTIQPLVPQLLQMEIEPAIRTMLLAVGELLMRHDGRYLHAARQGLGSLPDDRRPIQQLMQELLMGYLMHQPHYLQLGNAATMSYIFIHGGIHVVMQFLHETVPPFSYETLVDGLAKMVGHYARRELEQRQQP